MDRPKLLSSAAIGEWIVAVLLAANLVWTVLCLGGYRPETMVPGWLFTAAALAVQLGFGAWEGRRPHEAALWLLPFLGYAAFNVAAVSPVPWLGWRDWLGWFQMAAVFWIMTNGLTRRGPRLMMLGVLAVLGGLAVLLAAYQRFVSPDWLMMGRTQAEQFIGRASGPFGIPNSLAAFLLLLVPPVLSLVWQRGLNSVERVFWAYWAAVFLFGLGLTISRGAWLSLILALIAWPFFNRNLPVQTRVLLAFTAFAGALLAGLVLYQAVPKVKQRLDAMVADAGERSRPILWQAGLELFLDAPVLGTGAGSYNTLFERHRPVGFRDEPQWAHNDYLNTLSDYGAMGFILFFGGAGWITVRTMGGRDRRSSIETGALKGVEADGVTTALGVGLGAFALSLFVDFHLKIPGLAMAVAVVAGELVQRLWPLPRQVMAGMPTRIGQLAASLGVVLVVLGVVLPFFRGEAERYAARQSIDRMAVMSNVSLNEYRQTLMKAVVSFSEATRLSPGNAQAWADRAYATELWSHVAPARMNELGREAEGYAREALTRSLDVPEFWVRHGVALDMQGRWKDAGESFIKAVELARFNSANWYYLAYHQSLGTAPKEEVINSIENCLRLDPSHRPALALRQRITPNR